MVWIIISFVVLCVVACIVTYKTTEHRELHKVRAAFEHYEEAHNLAKDVLKGLHIAEDIVSDLESGSTTDMRIGYSVSISFKDDGKHFPYTTYSDYFYCNGNLTDDEILRRAKVNMIERYPTKNGGRTYEGDINEGGKVSVYGVEKCIMIN